jgi:tRNA(Ile)-lysidine synthase
MADVATKEDAMNALERRLAESWPVREWCDVHIVLAVSGGADSVAMLQAMGALKADAGGRGKLCVAHLNHGLRGKAADEDQAWVQELCRQLQVSLEVGRRDIGAIAEEHGDGCEAAARTARYEFLVDVAERVGARFVVTAHTADDQAETVLHRILRGTGIEGLAGIAMSRLLTESIALVRPMLAVRRREVVEYLAAIGQDYRTDASNDDTQWTRNRLRHELLPRLREDYNSRVDEALLRLAVQAGELQGMLSSLVAETADEVVVADASRLRVDCATLEVQPPIVIREIFKVAWKQAGWPQQSMGFKEWQQLARLISRDGVQSINLPGDIRACRRDGFVVVERFVG